MTDVEVQAELQLENVPSGQYSLGGPRHEEMGGGGKEFAYRQSLQNCGQTGQIKDNISYLFTSIEI